jgi:hypothetical protein
MQMSWGWAVVAAIALGTGLAWWFQPAHDDERVHKSEAGETDTRGAGHHKRSQGNEGPTLYRWVDDNGVMNITDRPPHGRSYTIVRIDPNRNVVHMSDLISSARTAAKPASTAH